MPSFHGLNFAKNIQVFLCFCQKINIIVKKLIKQEFLNKKIVSLLNMTSDL
ncbi:MAG: hypothetical protein XD67_0790 [Thermodesulfobacterium commune]|jgi:hypothetical protein|nr:MAG: hypothetical protein XD67_0790 [Thermodesulfobacterium commune]MDN5379641.1 hypothetical protein [Thermodesulfobacterium sp.]